MAQPRISWNTVRQVDTKKPTEVGFLLLKVSGFV